MDELTPRDQIRAADADRQRVAEQLRSAHDEGRLDLAEYDERLQQAWAARTYAELDRLTADLPAGRPQPVPAAQGSLAASGDGREQLRRGRNWHGSVTAWLSASLINLVIWAIVSLSTLSWIYPWWIWVAGPWGAVLLARWVAERSDAARPPDERR
ncbi:MAG TPA: DUF1707 domain-containing protein [Pseudonocardiaceae bacterium]|nr:DUF1707 domain-containing protein [Pseudonocardiaceae bacterium]